LNGKLYSTPSRFRGADLSIPTRALASRAFGPLALCALVALTQSAAPANDLLAAATPAAAATGAPAAGAPAASAGAIHDHAGGKPVAIIYDNSRWTGQFLGIAQGVAESAQDFAAKFGHRFNVETTVIQATISSPKDVDDAVKASGALLGTFYSASIHGEPHHKTTDWTFKLGTKLRDAAGTVWIDAKNEADQEYPGLSDYHAITLSHLTDLNDQIIDALAKASEVKP
jgi:hypothetical protein